MRDGKLCRKTPGVGLIACQLSADGPCVGDQGMWDEAVGLGQLGGRSQVGDLTHMIAGGAATNIPAKVVSCRTPCTPVDLARAFPDRRTRGAPVSE